MPEPPQLPPFDAKALPVAKRTCWPGSEAPQNAPSTTQLHLETGLAVGHAHLFGAV